VPDGAADGRTFAELLVTKLGNYRVDVSNRLACDGFDGRGIEA
jgi:hypothetical protein